MTAVLLTPLTGQFFDNNGNPLNGGLIYSYVAGTGYGTPQATYTDATGSTPAANPVVCNSAGRADIWGVGNYDFKITDSLGNTLDTIASVSAIYGAGDMTKAVYDPANIAQQLVGTTAVQTLTNKTFVAPVLGAASATSIALPTGTITGQVSSYLSTSFSLTTQTALQNVTNMSYAIGANQNWVATAFLDIGGAIGTTGFKLAVTTPAGAAQNITASATLDVVSTSNVTYTRTTSSGTALTYTAASLPSATIAGVWMNIYVANGATPGTVQLQFAQSTSSGTAARINAGSWMLASRVA
jgi:hypothetical protein